MPKYTKFEPEIVRDAELANAELAQMARRLLEEEKTLTHCMAKVRHALREQRDFVNADALREGLENAGFYVEDRVLDGHPMPPHAVYRKEH